MSGRLDSSQRFAAREFQHLLDYLAATDYGVVDCLAQIQETQRRTIAFRYDVHLRDVHCAHGFLRVHCRRGVAGTFFLLHDYSGPERENEAKFVALAEGVRSAQQAGVPVRLGLHDSPVDRYLQWRFADGHEGRYVEWLSSAAAAVFFRETAGSAQARQEFEAAVTERFVQSVKAARAALGDFELSAGHGGKLSQVLRPRLSEFGEAAALIEQCFSENWLGTEQLAAAGLAGDVERFKQQAPEIAAITEAGGRLVRMCERLQAYVAVGRPITALIHPATWERNQRDAEWSQRLALPAPRKPRVAVSVNPAAWMKEFAGTAASQPFDLAVFTESPNTDATLAAELDVQVVTATSFADLVGDPRHSAASYDVVLGKSVERYGSLVLSLLAAALGCSAPELVEPNPVLNGRRGEAFARWLERESRQSKPRVTPAELAYFLFSSSQRALRVARALSHFCRGRGVPGLDTFVDHGAGIGFVPLIIDSWLPIGSVVCSEVKPQFIEAGRSLWAALGLESRIEFQAVSVVDFVYPARVDAIFFGHMLYRLPLELRGPTLQAAFRALKPGGLLVINELMNRPDLDATYAYRCLTSEELFEFLGAKNELFAVETTATVVNVEPARSRDAAFFRRSDNIVVAVRPQ